MKTPKINSNRPLTLGLAMAAFWIGAAHAQVTLDPAWRVTPDTTKPGFMWSYFQNNGNTENSTTRTEAALLGLLKDSTGASLPNNGDPTVVGVAINPAAPANPTNGLLFFEITNVINLSKFDGDFRGNFTPDGQEPGVDTTISTDGQAAEILTYVTLPAGTITLGVNSDDGFQSASGANPADAFSRVVLGEYSGGRGASDTWFTFVVTQAGTYPLRTIWENGGGDSNIELFQVITNSSSTNLILVNDLANGGLPAYRALAAGTVSPYIKGVSPTAAPRQVQGVSKSVTVTLSDGSTAVNDSSITLKIDGVPATLTKVRQGSLVTVDSGTVAGFQAPGESHTAVLTFKNVGATYSRTQAWTFYNLENLILPVTPVAGENFDSYPEATAPSNIVPTGWTASNYSWLETGASGFGGNGGDVWDLTSQANDPYLNWIMVNTNTGAALESQILDNDQSQTINGIPLTNGFMSGNCLFSASDGRARHCSVDGADLPNDYAPQIQIVVTAPFNLSTVTNPVLAWHSGVRISGNGEQDSLEYSVDNGSTWLPGIIMHNGSRIFLNLDGSYDAMKMMTNVWPDVARFPVVQDPSTRNFISAGPLGGKFGDVLATPVSPALAPFIVQRGDTSAARRVEALRLPAASRKSQVRLRFVHYGSCGWMWAIDNIAFYDIATRPRPVITSITSSGANVTIQWTGGGTLESATSLSNPTWVSTGDITGSHTETRTAGAKFYRVKQ